MSNILNGNVDWVSRLIIEMDDHLFWIEDSKDKIEDISKMPEYISRDWFNYNKKELKTRDIDFLIKIIEGSPCSSSNLKVLVEDEYNRQEKIAQLKSIRRDLVIRQVNQGDSHS